MLARSTQYAIDALALLAQAAPDAFIPARTIVAETGIPQCFGLKVLCDLGRAGLLESTRGVGGGYRLAISPDRVSLLQVISMYQDLKRTSTRAAGRKQRSARQPTGSKYVRRIFTLEREFLSRTTLADIIDADSDRPATSRRADRTSASRSRTKGRR